MIMEYSLFYIWRLLREGADLTIISVSRCSCLCSVTWPHSRSSWRSGWWGWIWAWPACSWWGWGSNCTILRPSQAAEPGCWCCVGITVCSSVWSWLWSQRTRGRSGRSWSCSWSVGSWTCSWCVGSLSCCWSVVGGSRWSVGVPGAGGVAEAWAVGPIVVGESAKLVSVHTVSRQLKIINHFSNLNSFPFRNQAFFWSSSLLFK